MRIRVCFVQCKRPPPGQTRVFLYITELNEPAAENTQFDDNLLHTLKTSKLPQKVESATFSVQGSGRS